MHTTKNLGVPGSSRGTLECNRVDLTVYAFQKKAVSDVRIIGDGGGGSLKKIGEIFDLVF